MILKRCWNWKILKMLKRWNRVSDFLVSCPWVFHGFGIKDVVECYGANFLEGCGDYYSPVTVTARTRQVLATSRAL